MVSEFSKLPLSDLQHDWSGTTPIFKISMFYRIFASRTRTLIGWTDVLSLINTSDSIPTVKTLPGIVICQTLPARFSFPLFCN